jgi:hypothetical protein
MTGVTGLDLKTCKLHNVSFYGKSEEDCEEKITEKLNEFGTNNPTALIIDIKVRRCYQGGYNRCYYAAIEIIYTPNRTTVRPKKAKKT